MTKYTFFLLVFFVSLNVSAQKTYKDSIAAFRQHYKEDFIKELRSPLKGKDTSFLRFYAASKEYKVVATVKKVTTNVDFIMETHSGKKQAYKQFAVAEFLLSGKKYQLHLYRNVSLMAQEEHKNHLFLPFNDLTNYETTYAGGRYIDLSLDDIKNGKIVIDFNKAYNPYCAFKDGYSCPIPPAENRLKVRIEAGEQLFGKKIMD